MPPPPPKDKQMTEATTNRTTRDAMQIAHQERAAAMKAAWAWMRGKSSR